MSKITLSNEGGILECDSYSWDETQNVKYPIQPIPTKSDGAYVNTNIHTINAKVLNITIKLTDAQKTTLESIFNESKIVTIVAENDGEEYSSWVYTAWFVKKPLLYRYMKSEDDSFEWLAELEFNVKEYYYTNKWYAVTYFYGSGNASPTLSLDKIDLDSEGEFTVTNISNDVLSDVKAIATNHTTYFLLGIGTDLYKLNASGLVLADDSSIETDDSAFITFIEYNKNDEYFLIGTMDNNYDDCKIYSYDGTTVTKLTTISDFYTNDVAWSPTLSKWLIVGRTSISGPFQSKYYTYDGTTFTDVTSTINYKTGSNVYATGCVWSTTDEVFVIIGEWYETGVQWWMFACYWDGSNAGVEITDGEDTYGFAEYGEDVWEVNGQIFISRNCKYSENFYNYESYFYTWDLTNGLSLINETGLNGVSNRNSGFYNVSLVAGAADFIYGFYNPFVRGLTKNSNGEWELNGDIDISKSTPSIKSGTTHYVAITCISKVLLE